MLYFFCSSDVTEKEKTAMLRIKSSSIFDVLICILGVIILIVLYLYGNFIDFIYVGIIFLCILLFYIEKSFK